MKKLPIKKFRRRSADTPPSARITNETVAEHRERILAGGRKFKYPIQYARHRLVINALLVTFASLILLVALGGWQLYIMQNSSTFLYRVTRIIPVPVAMVNGEQVRFSDYLVQYRGSEHYLNKYGEKLNTADGKRQLDYVKRESMNKAIADAYAQQIAHEKGITVSSKDVDALIDEQRNTANGRISQETYDASSMMIYGWSPSDYRMEYAHGILRARVAFAVDTNASKQAQQVSDALKQQPDADFAKVAEQLATSAGGKVIAGQSGLVNNNSTFGGLRASELASLEKGKTSGMIKSSTDDGYYFVRILEKNDTQVNFAYLHIPLTQFNNDLAQLKKNGKVAEYIKIADK